MIGMKSRVAKRWRSRQESRSTIAVADNRRVSLAPVADLFVVQFSSWPLLLPLVDLDEVTALVRRIDAGDVDRGRSVNGHGDGVTAGNGGGAARETT